MELNDIQYKNNMKEISKGYTPLNWLLILFSLNRQNVLYRNTYIVVIKKAIPAIILACLNTITLYYKVTNFHVNLRLSVIYTDVVQMVYDVFQYLVDLIYVYKYGAELNYEYIKQYAYIDSLLGTNYYKTIRRRLRKIMVFLLCMWFFSSLCDYIIWSNGFGLIMTTIFSIAYIYIFIKIMTNLDLSCNVMQVECRLRALGDTIQDCCNATECSSGILEDLVSKKDWFYNENPTIPDKPKWCSVNIISCLDKKEVKWLSRCYLLLTEQVTFINKMFGMRILLNSLSLLIDLVRFTNLTVLLLVGSQSTGYGHGYYAAIPTIWRMITCISAIVSLVHQCELVYRQRERIVFLLDHLIIDKNLGEQQLEAFNEFRSLVQSRTINFHMAHFIRLDYPLLVSIASVVVTYTIILLQSIQN